MTDRPLILKLLTFAVIVCMAWPQLRLANCCCAGMRIAGKSSCCKSSAQPRESTEQGCCCAKKEMRKAASEACCQVGQGGSKGCDCSCKSRTVEQTTPSKRRVSEQVLDFDNCRAVSSVETAAERLLSHQTPLIFKPPARVVYCVWLN